MSFEFFDKVYCINLPNDKERKQLITKQFEGVGIDDVTFVHASPPPPGFTMSNMRREARGEFGVNLSQIKAVVTAIADGAKRPLFFEDDIVFKDTQVLEQALKELPNKWSVLYLGGHPRGPIPKYQAKKVSNTLVKVQRYSFADAYSINGEHLLSFYQTWCNKITQSDAMYDFILGEYAGQNNGYAIYPLVCEQRPGTSSISNKHDDKRSIVARAWTMHLGEEQVISDHRELVRKWKRKHPGMWEKQMKRQAEKSKK